MAALIQQGVSQQTPAAQNVWRTTGGNSGPRRKRRKKRASSKATGRSNGKRRASSSSRKPARLVKGSAAAKAYMAKIRRKRKK